MLDNAHGGDDSLIGVRGVPKHDFNATNTLVGDGGDIYGNAEGGNDTLTGGVLAINSLFGDAISMHGNAQGGNDTLSGGAVSFNVLVGDGNNMYDNARGGDDTLTAGFGSSPLGGLATLKACPTAPAAGATRSRGAIAKAPWSATRMRWTVTPGAATTG